MRALSARRMGGTLVAAMLLALVVLAGRPAGAAPDPQSESRASSQGAADVKSDRDGDKVFEDLEGRMVRAPRGAKVNVIVTLRSPASSERLEALVRDAGAFAVSRRFSVVDGFSATMTKAQVRVLARRGDVAHIEEDSRMQAANDSAQASFGASKARADVPGLDGDRDGNPTTYSREDLVAAVLDTGIDAGHRDLDGGKVLAFADFVNGRASPYDDNGHGTHVAATLAGDGEARSDRLHQGVAPGAALVGVKVLDAQGGASESTVIAGVDWAVANRNTYGIKVINLSLGGGGCSDGTDSLSRAVNRANTAGLLVVAAAGNEGPNSCTIGSPGAADGAVTVGSMADLSAGGFAQSYFSSRGPTVDGRIKPDISAPGERIRSAAAGTGTGYREQRGTSMATPFVAGVAVLMRDANPLLSSQQVKDKLKQTAVDWGRGGDGRTAGTSGPDIDYGAGRLDAYAAIKSAGASLSAPPDTPAHQRMDGMLSGVGAQVDHQLDVTDTRFPIAATLITPAGLPDFALDLFDPAGTRVASSDYHSRQEDVRHIPTVTGAYKLRVRSLAGSGGYVLDISSSGSVRNADAVPPPAWGNWQSLGGVLTSAPGVSSRGLDRLDVFARGSDNALYQRSFSNGAWSNWQSLGGVITSDPAAVSWGSERIDVFVRGTDNALYQRSFNGQRWSDWQSLGGVLNSAPGVSSRGPDRLDVFVRGTDNALYQRSFSNGAWSNWQSLGGVITSDPAAVSWGSERIDVFVRGTDNALYQRSFNGQRWSDWQSLGGVLNSAPGVSSRGPDRLDVFVRGTDNALYQRSFSNGAWSNWQSLGGVITSDPAAVSWGSERIDVFVRGTDNALYQRSFGTGS